MWCVTGSDVEKFGKFTLNFPESMKTALLPQFEANDLFGPSSHIALSPFSSH